MSKFELTIIIPTLNSSKQLKKFFMYLNKQVFKKESLEILIIDGGSKDDTLKIAKKEKARIINNVKVLAEPGVDLGIKNAQSEIIVILAADNFLVDSYFLKKIKKVFENKKVAAAFPKQESFLNSNLYTKYINTFTDPFNHFVYGHAANARTFNRVYETKKKTSLYEIFDFQSNKNLPILALAQGFSLRKNFSRNKKNEFDDVYPVYQLIKAGKNIAYIYSTGIVHETIKNASHFIHKQEWATINALKKRKYGIVHRRDTLTKWQKIKMRIWPFYAFSIIFPIINSMRGVLIDKELIWFFHPIMCFFSAYGSLKAIKYLLLKKDEVFVRN